MVFASPKLQKTLVPGRLLVITTQYHINKLAILLTTVRSKQTTFKVLVLSNPSEQHGESKDISWYHMIGLAQEKLFVPVSTIGHDIVTVSALDIFEVGIAYD